MDQTDKHYFADKGFEVSRVIFLLIISALLGVSAYVWTTTVTRLETEIVYERGYIANLEERIRLSEIANERQNAILAGMANRLDTQRDHLKQLDDLYYGPYRRKP